MPAFLMASLLMIFSMQVGQGGSEWIERRTQAVPNPGLGRSFFELQLPNWCFYPALVLAEILFLALAGGLKGGLEEAKCPRPLAGSSVITAIACAALLCVLLPCIIVGIPGIFVNVDKIRWLALLLVLTVNVFIHLGDEEGQEEFTGNVPLDSAIVGVRRTFVVVCAAIGGLIWVGSGAGGLFLTFAVPTACVSSVAVRIWLRANER